MWLVVLLLPLSLFCVSHIHVSCTKGIERTTQERNSDVGGEQQKSALTCDVIVCARGDKKIIKEACSFCLCQIHLTSSVFWNDILC